jgi:predicted transcriptional regulator
MPIRRTTILVEGDLLERVDRHARRMGLTKTAVITAALEAYLEAEEAGPDLAFIGVGRSSHGRLSIDGRPILRREVGRREAGRPEAAPNQRGTR